jgi:hypothetical protein
LPLSLYDASIPPVVRALEILATLLRKGQVHAEAEKLDPSALLDARLAPDMLPLSAQVQRVSDTAKGAAARLAGAEMPSFPDEETSFSELQERIAKTLAFVKSIRREDIDGQEAREIVLSPRRGTPMTFTGQSYLQTFVLPNVYFHLSIAHGILRNQGVPIGKLDYLGVV